MLAVKYRIKDIRKEKGIQQDKLAQLSGVSREIISGLEADSPKRTTTVETLQKISAVLKVPVSELFYIE